MVITVADILDAETMMASSWPALKVSMSGRWVLGMANGLTGRANSLFFLDPNDDKNCAERLDWMEATFRRVGLAPRVRLTPLAPPAVIALLKQRGYIFQSPTITLKRVLNDGSVTGFEQQQADPSLDIEVFSDCSEEWLETFLSGTPRFQDKRATFEEMMANFLDDVGFILIRKDGCPAATLMVVHHLGIVNIQNVMTLKNFRKQGLARQGLYHGLRWALDHKASWCWVAVEKDNESATNLYRSLRFDDFYQYIYAALDE